MGVSCANVSVECHFCIFTPPRAPEVEMCYCPSLGSIRRICRTAALEGQSFVPMWSMARKRWQDVTWVDCLLCILACLPIHPKGARFVGQRRFIKSNCWKSEMTIGNNAFSGRTRYSQTKLGLAGRLRRPVSELRDNYNQPLEITENDQISFEVRDIVYIK